jgi:hypothetical protein
MIVRLKDRLRPFRGVLLPIWRRIEPVVSEGFPHSIPTLAHLAAGRAGDAWRAIRRRPEPPIRPLRGHELVRLATTVPYYRARRGYMSVAGSAAADLIDRKSLRTALELGPHLRSLIVGADVMDLSARPELRSEGRVIVHDATRPPWPVEDKAYDLFVALQVFEHLGTRQPETFREVRRVARNAILSLPIDWDMADPRNCHHQLSHERVLSWFGSVAPTRVLVGNPGRRKRLIYVFEDLPAPDAAPLDRSGPDAAAPEGSGPGAAAPATPPG